MFVLLLFFSLQIRPAQASVRVTGLHDWLAAGAERSLNAVYDHIPSTEGVSVKEQLLTVVANRLLLGYAVERTTFRADHSVEIALRATASPPDWRVSLQIPNLSRPVDAWFLDDVTGLDAEIALLMKDVPTEALSWGDLELKRVIGEICADRLPGWRVSLMLRNLPGGEVVLEVAFTPEQPLTLAVTSRINSSSIPVMLHSNLKDDLLKGFAPVIGIPVPWLDMHKADFVEMSKEILAGESLVDQAKAEPVITARTGTVSELDIDLESKRYAAWVWMAVYGGADDRYPEIGLHFGRRTLPFSGWEVELYTELIVTLDDWDLESRFGLRWSPYRSFWFGGEWSTEHDVWWIRASTDPRPRRPYAWFRYALDGDTNAAVGYRVNEYISLEVHYDSRDGDPWNVRALVNL